MLLSSEIEFEYDDDTESNNSFESDIVPHNDEYSVASPNRDHENVFKSTFTSIWYKPWNISDYIKQNYLKKVETLQSGQLPNCTFDDILCMLQYKRWQIDEVVNDYYDNQQLLYQNCGLPLKSTNKFETLTNFECLICCETYPQVHVYSLTCNHRYCVDCYYRYIDNDIYKGELITCIDINCKYTIPHRDIDEIVWLTESGHDSIKTTDILASNRLLISCAKKYIETKWNYRWCPGLDCNDFVELIEGDLDEGNKPENIDHVPIVKCPSYHEFCFNCKFENHLPCPCWIVKLWITKCEDDSETANWIDANTHSCPNCQSSIEKNGGCNHMTCSKCNHQFCWICLNDWSKHRDYYKCNSYVPSNPENEKSINKSRESLKRYLHYYKRFTAHESSSKGDLRTIESIEKLANEYMHKKRFHNKSSYLSWNDIQYLPDAIRALTRGRKTLKWTYCFAYYLGNSNFGQIFEENQNYLNQTVELLSEIFETITSKKNTNKIETIQTKKTDIVNLTHTIMHRQNALIQGCNDTLKEGLIYFEA